MPNQFLRNLTHDPMTVGDDVADWQQFLTDQGFDPGPVDGDFGDKTETATIAFQKKQKLTPDGKVGNDTFAAAMALGFKPLVHVDAKPPSDKVVELDSLGDVSIFKLKSGEAVFFTARMHVDADGCPRAYHPKNEGIENLGNAKKKDGSLSSDVIVFQGGEPFVQPSGPAKGFLVSKTSLRNPTGSATDPATYVDALTIPYIVIPGGKLGAGRVGDVALVVDLESGNRVKAIVADAGPVSELGEASIFCAGTAIGLKPAEITEAEARRKGSFINPRNGGTEKKRFRYIVFPGTKLTWPKTKEEIAARVDGVLAQLTPDQLLAITN